MEIPPLPALATYEDLAGMIEYPLLRPDLAAAQVIDGLDLARRYGAACAVVRPCDIDLAVRTLGAGPLRAGSVVGFPHGSQTTGVKLFEARDLLRRGAKELETVIAVSRLLSREFQHVQTELNQLSDLCRQEGAVLKVTLENAWLTHELKVIAITCCERADVHFVKTSTGFSGAGWTPADLKLMRDYLPEEIGILAEGDFATVDQVIEARALGCSRVSTTTAPALLDEWKARLAATAPTTSAMAPSTPPSP